MFARLWCSQAVSSLGDWLGLVAITALAYRLGAGSDGAAISLVLIARLVPGLFLASFAGVLVDRWDRRRVMVACDVGRGTVLALLPFATNVGELVAASFVLEMLTLMWTPAKEASVPNLVPPSFLPNANSLSLAAAYGTFPVAAALFAALAAAAPALGVRQESLAMWADVATFFLSAAVISTLSLPRPKPQESGDRGFDLGRTIVELREGWQFVVDSPVVRAVIIGLGTGMIGGAMIVPLGPIMAKQVFGAGPAGFGVLLASLGVGVAGGIVGLGLVQHRVDHVRVFLAALLSAGPCLLLGAAMSHLGPACFCVGALGLCAGAVYVLGFSLLQANVADELRGRTFATLYATVRICVLLALTVAPVLSGVLDVLSTATVRGQLHLGPATLSVPGVRLTLWLAGLIIVGAGLLARRTLGSPVVAGAVVAGPVVAGPVVAAPAVEGP